MFKKQVKCCRKCGFLALTGELRVLEVGTPSPVELKQQDRDKLILGTYYKHHKRLTCTRGVWSGKEAEDFVAESGVLDLPGSTLTLTRENRERGSECACFFPYSQGCSPSEHKELQRDAKVHRALIIGMVLAALVSSVFALASILIVHLW